MTVEQAINILDPDSITDWKSYAENLKGVSNQDAFSLGYNLTKEACRIACKIMRQYLNDMVVCPQ